MEDNMRIKSNSNTSLNQLQGPRPTPLKISKESHSSMKSTYRKPVIIYLRSPEVIHSKPEDFMALVQRLTGQGSCSSSNTYHNSSAEDVAILKEEEKPTVQRSHDSVNRYDLKDNDGNRTDEQYLEQEKQLSEAFSPWCDYYPSNQQDLLGFDISYDEQLLDDLLATESQILNYLCEEGEL